MKKEYIKIDWLHYKEFLIKLNYTQEDIENVRLIRENPENEIMSPEQFDFLFQQGIIKRTQKLKKKRTLLVFDDKIWYLSHYHRRYVWCGYFINDEEV